MTAALVLPISGPYTATWNALTLGVQNDDGYVLTGQWQGQEVNASDVYGMTLVEAIYRGVNWRMRSRGLEFNSAGYLAAVQACGPAASAGTTFVPNLANIGERMSALAKTLILTAILSNPPCLIQSLTSLLAIIAPQSNVEYLMTSKVREAPIEFILLPYVAVVASTTVKIAFTTT